MSAIQFKASPLALSIVKRGQDIIRRFTRQPVRVNTHNNIAQEEKTHER